MEQKNRKNTVVPPPPPTNLAPIVTDPFGSHTGLVYDCDDQPVQDADDL